MLGRRIFREKWDHTEECKHGVNSLETQESVSPDIVPKNQFHTKEKSELCGKFMEFGYCSYLKNCKFAHGYHELKKNNNMNSKYKTKECGSFIYDYQCRFGDRCNFIHPSNNSVFNENKHKHFYREYRQIFYQITDESKLPHLFE